MPPSCPGVQLRVKESYVTLVISHDLGVDGLSVNNVNIWISLYIYERKLGLIKLSTTLAE